MNKNNEWYTPKYVLVKVRNVFGGNIELDPCSSKMANSRRVKASKHYSKDDSCLKRELNAKNAFLNPPYSNDLLYSILEYVVNQFEIGNINELIVLTNSGTDTKWNQLLKNGTQAYTIGRIRFVDPQGFVAGAPCRGQVFTYFGDNKEKFIKEFTKDNFCWVPNLKEIAC